MFHKSTLLAYCTTLIAVYGFVTFKLVINSIKTNVVWGNDIIFRKGLSFMPPRTTGNMNRELKGPCLSCLVFLANEILRLEIAPNDINHTRSNQVHDISKVVKSEQVGLKI